MNSQAGDVQYAFLARLYNMYMHEYYWNAYKDSSIKWLRIIETIVSCAPVVTLVLIGFMPTHATILISIASVLSAFEAASKFLPYRTRINEIHTFQCDCTLVVSRMENAWSDFRCNRISIESLAERANESVIELSSIESRHLKSRYPESDAHRDCAIDHATSKMRNLTAITVEEFLDATRK